MDFWKRVAIGLSAFPEILREWPRMQALPMAGALIDFCALRFAQKRPAGRAIARAFVFCVALEAVIAFTLVIIQAWFYWTPG